MNTPMTQEQREAELAEYRRQMAEHEANRPQVEYVQVRPDRRTEPQTYESGLKVGRKAQYPWAEWLDGEWHGAEHGLDFQCKPASFRSYLYNYALNNGYTVETMILSHSPVSYEFRFTREG